MKKEIRLELINLTSYFYALFSQMEIAKDSIKIDKTEFNYSFNRLSDIAEKFTENDIEDEEILSDIGGVYMSAIVARNIIKKGEMN